MSDDEEERVTEQNAPERPGIPEYLLGTPEFSNWAPSDNNAVTEEPFTPPSRRWRRPTILAAVVVLIAAMVGGVLETSGSSSNADAAVISAVNHALASKSASVTMTEQGSVGTESLSFSGTGGINFANNSFQVNMTGTADGQNLTIDVMYIGGSIYEEIPQLSQLDPGKSWLSLNVSSLAKADATTNTSALGTNPLATLQTLAQQGNTVTALGSSTVDGQSVQGYSVTFSQAALKREINSATLPSWMRAAASQASLKSGTEKVFINGGTLVQVSIAVGVTTATGTVTMNESLDFSNYGTPVTITAPPTSETIPFAQLAKLAQGTAS